MSCPVLVAHMLLNIITITLIAIVLFYSAAIGPFRIKCKSKDKFYYWKEGGSGKIEVTQDEAEATMFSICLEDISHPNEFAIQKFQTTGPTERLACNVTTDGRSTRHAPPTIKQTFYNPSDQRWCLKDPNGRKGNVANPRNWLSCSDWFVIRCSRRRALIKGKGKLCIKINSDYLGELTVIPSSKSHNGNDVLMHFCLQKVSRKAFEYV